MCLESYKIKQIIYNINFYFKLLETIPIVKNGSL